MFPPSPEAATLLAIDTATDRLCVALGTPRGDWLRDEAGGAQASARLLPLVRELAIAAGLRQAWEAEAALAATAKAESARPGESAQAAQGAETAETGPPTTAPQATALSGIDAIAFGRGPGAFTGLRTACAVAQGLAWGLDRPVLAIDSLMILAEAASLAGAFSGAAPDAAVDCWVAVDARMDEVYAACYRRSPGGQGAESVAMARTGGSVADGAWPAWQVLSPPSLYTLPALADRWTDQRPQWLVGNAATLFADRLPLQGVRCPSLTGDRAAGLLSLARAAWQRGESVDPAEALPLYLRDKVALTTAEREVERAAKLAAIASPASTGPEANP